jgi:hypothetical protein
MIYLLAAGAQRSRFKTRRSELKYKNSPSYLATVTSERATCKTHDIYEIIDISLRRMLCTQSPATRKK